MNSRGIFCFVLLLAFFALEVNFFSEASEVSHELARAKAVAFEAEKTSFVRALIENSVDVAIDESLKQGLILNLEPEEMKKQVNSRLAILFRKMENEYSRGIMVGFDSKALDESFLNQNSSVLVARIDKKTIGAEYSFTGGIMKNSYVSAQIAGSMAKQFFRMPAGYTVKVRVIG